MKYLVYPTDPFEYAAPDIDVQVQVGDFEDYPAKYFTSPSYTLMEKTLNEHYEYAAPDIDPPQVFIMTKTSTLPDKKVVAKEKVEYRCVKCGHTFEDYLYEVVCQCCCDHVHHKGCAQPMDDCGCCKTCDTFRCTCDGAEPSSHTPKPLTTEMPWEQRGIQVKIPKPTALWNAAWKIGHSSLDPIQCCAEFYVLDYLSAYRVLVPKQGFDGGEATAIVNADPMFTLLRDDARRLHVGLLKKLDVSFARYADMAVGGELRHHHGVRVANVLPSKRSSAWSYWKYVREQVGLEALEDAAQLFREFTKGGFGGEPWAQIALTLHDRLTGRLTPHQWVDRCWTLEHNNGTFLNKVTWAVENPKNWTYAHLHNVLNAHAMDDFYLLLSLCRMPIRELWRDIHLQGNRIGLRWGVPVVRTWPRQFTPQEIYKKAKEIKAHQQEFKQKMKAG